MVPNNPAAIIMQMIQGGGSPMNFLQQISGQNPQINMLVNLMNGKNPTQLKEIATNMAKQRGTTPQEVLNQFIGGNFNNK